MRLALEEARLGANAGEVPVGAIVALHGEVIARAHNQTEQLRDATAHAEILALRQASRQLSRWRLEDVVLCATLEPCTMCAGAIRLARVPLVVFGAGDSRYGAFGSTVDLSLDTRPGPVPSLMKDVLAAECRSLLKDFFAERRG